VEGAEKNWAKNPSTSFVSRWRKRGKEKLLGVKSNSIGEEHLRQGNHPYPIRWCLSFGVGEVVINPEKGRHDCTVTGKRAFHRKDLRQMKNRTTWIKKEEGYTLQGSSGKIRNASPGDLKKMAMKAQKGKGTKSILPKERKGCLKWGGYREAKGIQ